MFKQFDIDFDKIIIDGMVLTRPSRISPSQWLEFWYACDQVLNDSRDGPSDVVILSNDEYNSDVSDAIIETEEKIRNNLKQQIENLEDDFNLAKQQIEFAQEQIDLSLEEIKNLVNKIKSQISIIY